MSSDPKKVFLLTVKDGAPAPSAVPDAKNAADQDKPLCIATTARPEKSWIFFKYMGIMIIGLIIIAVCSRLSLARAITSRR